MIWAVAAAVCFLALACLFLLATLYRISANTGPLTLEEWSKRNGVVLVPISLQLVSELEKGWSKPLRMRMQRHPNQPLLGELICTDNIEEPPDA